MKHPFKIDVPVLITFFVRPDTLQKVFDSVKQARPSVLLLWQDGPRANRADDLENVIKCRKIVEDIDWECIVYKNYNESNYGCDPSTFLAQKWAFSLVDKCIILEDDRVPRLNHFILIVKNYLINMNLMIGLIIFVVQICWKITKIANMIISLHKLDLPLGLLGDVLRKGWDETYTYLQDKYAMDCLKNSLNPALYKVIKDHASTHEKEGKQYWETILGMDCLLNNRLVIIPKKNMVVDLGLTENSTHAVANPKLLPKFARKMFYMKSYDVNFPLKHPKYIIKDNMYYNTILSNAGIGRPFISFVRKIEYLLRCLCYGEFGRIFKSIKKKF